MIFREIFITFVFDRKSSLQVSLLMKDNFGWIKNQRSKNQSKIMKNKLIRALYLQHTILIHSKLYWSLEKMINYRYLNGMLYLIYKGNIKVHN